MKQIFPKEIITNTIEAHQFKHSHRSKIIYGIITLAVIGGIIALPLIKVDIYNTSRGLIRSNKEKVVVQNIISGEVTFHKLKNNEQVEKGDTLLLINNTAITQKIKNTTEQHDTTEKIIGDLELIIESENNLNKLTTAEFKQEYFLYQQELKELNIRFKKLKEDYIRNIELYDKGVVAKVELNNYKLEHDVALNNIYQYKKKQHKIWQTQLMDYKNRLKNLQNTHAQLTETHTLSVIIAPITGTILNVRGIERGSFLPVGVQIAEISPNSDLLVECYVNPVNIGMLEEEQVVSFQVEAFNYNQWGLATGKIIEIANDVQLINNTPMFRVLCSLDHDFLQLKNGFKGYLKKGMTLNARFKLTERTLFNLLYDKMSDWLSPGKM